MALPQPYQIESGVSHLEVMSRSRYKGFDAFKTISVFFVMEIILLARNRLVFPALHPHQFHAVHPQQPYTAVIGLVPLKYQHIPLKIQSSLASLSSSQFRREWLFLITPADWI